MTRLVHAVSKPDLTCDRVQCDTTSYELLKRPSGRVASPLLRFASNGLLTRLVKAGRASNCNPFSLISTHLLEIVVCVDPAELNIWNFLKPTMNVRKQPDLTTPDTSHASQAGLTIDRADFAELVKGLRDLNSWSRAKPRKGDRIGDRQE